MGLFSDDPKVAVVVNFPPELFKAVQHASEEEEKSIDEIVIEAVEDTFEDEDEDENGEGDED